MSRCSALLCLLLHLVSLVQTAPIGLPVALHWDAAKLLQIQQELEQTQMLYLRILREQQLHRSLIEVELIIDIIILAGVMLLCSRSAKQTEKKTLINDKVAKTVEL